MIKPFKYIDEDLQNLKQLVQFRLDDLIKKQPSVSGSATCLPGVVRSCDKEANSSTSLTTHLCGVGKPEQHEHGKPPFHYSDLIEFALRDKQQLTVSEIYDWIIQRFPYFRHIDDSRWKPAVRHTLTTNSAFYKARKATRGYLWAYRDPDLNRKSDSNRDQPAPNSHWKKQKLQEYTSYPRNPPPISDRPLVSMVTSSPTVSTSTRPVLPVGGNRLRQLPPSTLSNTQTIMVVDLPDSEDLEMAAVPPQAQYHCQAQYYLPKPPSGSQTNIGPNLPNIPCCRDRNNDCCLRKDCEIPDSNPRNNSDWVDLWHKLHTSDSLSSSHGCTPTEPHVVSGSQEYRLACGSGSLDRLSTPLHSGLMFCAEPVARRADSGHLLEVPVVVPVYNMADVLRNTASPAHFHLVPKELVLEESGLLAEAMDQSKIHSTPSVSTLCSSGSATRALEEILCLDNLHRSDGLNTPSPTPLL